MNAGSKFVEWYNAQPFNGRLLCDAWQAGRGAALVEAQQKCREVSAEVDSQHFRVAAQRCEAAIRALAEVRVKHG